MLIKLVKNVIFINIFSAQHVYQQAQKYVVKYFRGSWNPQKPWGHGRDFR